MDDNTYNANWHRKIGRDAMWEWVHRAAGKLGGKIGGEIEGSLAMQPSFATPN